MWTSHQVYSTDLHDSKHYVDRGPCIGKVGRSVVPGDDDVGESHSGGGSDGRS